MIKTCACGKEFLTEADPYVILPKPSGVEVNCGCYFQQDLLASASDGFDEWVIKRGIKGDWTTGINKETWQAANIRAIKMFNSTDDLVRMSYITECLEIHYESEIERLQKENEELKVDVKKINDDYWFMINLIEKYSSNKDEALKDILERLKFRKPLLEKWLMGEKK